MVTISSINYNNDNFSFLPNFSFSLYFYTIFVLNIVLQYCLIEWNNYKTDGNLDHQETFKYDDKGNIIESAEYNFDGSLRCKIKHQTTIGTDRCCVYVVCHFLSK